MKPEAGDADFAYDLPMMDFKTVSRAAECEYIEKRSRFIACVMPVSSEADALLFMNTVKKRYFGARHHVYAYSLRENNTKRFSDDGEPPGTAGLPVLTVLEREEVTDCALVVARIFGGILLGAAGLVRAYAHAAKMGLDAAGVVLKKGAYLLEVMCDYSFYARLEALVLACGGRFGESTFSEKVCMRFVLPKADFSLFSEKIREISFGKITPVVISETFL